ncbi:hypothetical protein SETIT_9G065900v2 [Setaria italica]|uniref:Uncharacterized protein n=1 Tax=Setaria italica TaxID=4555 RepID=A0A368SDY8_SETIT|nr:hypothetical protein SETIT_9G065900v2 [Setaria italica]
MVMLNSCHLALPTERVRSGGVVVVSGGYCLEDGAATICTSTATSLCLPIYQALALVWFGVVYMMSFECLC